MVNNGAYKFRLVLTETQKQLCRQFAGNNRFLWNRMLDLNLQRLTAGEKILTYGEMASLLVTMKKEPATEFLKLSPSQTLQQVLLDLERALNDWLFGSKKSNKKARPQFKSRKDCRDSFRFPQGFHILGPNSIKLPKLGEITYRNGRHSKYANKKRIRDFVGKTPKNVTVSLDGNQWDMSVCWEQDLPEEIHPRIDSVIGIDRNVVGHRDNNGVRYPPFVPPPNLLQKIVILQRSLSRKVRKSSNHRKVAEKLARASTKLVRMARDYIEKLTTTIAKSHGIVILEKLLVQNMTASAKGTIANPGKNVRQKAGLNRSILSQRFGLFRLRLVQKILAAGGIVVYVDPAYSSQECSACGHIDPANRRSQSEFFCTACGYAENADTNAAKVIEARGLKEAPLLLREKIDRIVSGAQPALKQSRWKKKDTVAGQVTEACGCLGFTEASACG